MTLFVAIVVSGVQMAARRLPLGELIINVTLWLLIAAWLLQLIGAARTRRPRGCRQGDHACEEHRPRLADGRRLLPDLAVVIGL